MALDVLFRVTADAKQAIQEFDRMGRAQEKATRLGVEGANKFQAAMNKAAIGVGAVTGAIGTITVALGVAKLAWDGINQVIDAFSEKSATASRAVDAQKVAIDKLANESRGSLIQLSKMIGLVSSDFKKMNDFAIFAKRRGLGEIDQVFQDITSSLAEGRAPKIFEALNISLEITGDKAKDAAAALSQIKDFLSFGGFSSVKGGLEWLDELTARTRAEAEIDRAVMRAGFSADFDAEVVSASPENVERLREERKRKGQERERDRTRAIIEQFSRGDKAIQDIMGDAAKLPDYAASDDGIYSEREGRISALDEQAAGLMRRRRDKNASFSQAMGFGAYGTAGMGGNSLPEMSTKQIEEMERFNAALMDTGTLVGGTFSALSDGIASAMDAAISGQEAFGTAMQRAIGQALKAMAIQNAIKALEMAAMGTAALALGPLGGTSAAQFFKASAMHTAVAALAGGASAALGGGSSGGGGGSGGAGGGFVSPRGRDRDSENQTIIINVGDGFVGNPDELAREIGKNLRKGSMTGATRVVQRSRIQFK